MVYSLQCRHRFTRLYHSRMSLGDTWRHTFVLNGFNRRNQMKFNDAASEEFQFSLVFLQKKKEYYEGMSWKNWFYSDRILNPRFLKLHGIQFKNFICCKAIYRHVAPLGNCARSSEIWQVLNRRESVDLNFVSHVKRRWKIYTSCRYGDWVRLSLDGSRAFHKWLQSTMLCCRHWIKRIPKLLDGYRTVDHWQHVSITSDI